MVQNLRQHNILKISFKMYYTFIFLQIIEEH